MQEGEHEVSHVRGSVGQISCTAQRCQIPDRAREFLIRDAQAFCLFIAFALTEFITVRWLFPYFAVQVNRPFGLLLFFVTFSFVQWPMGILQLLFSRDRERKADAFTAERIHVAKPLGDALEKLTVQNFAQFKPNAILEFFAYSHPAPWRRIMKLRTP
jgi:Zn-dependent protease with chaperone function